LPSHLFLLAIKIFCIWHFRPHHQIPHEISIEKVANSARSEATLFIGRLFREYAPVLCHSRWMIHARIERIHNPPQMKIVAARPIFVAVVIFSQRSSPPIADSNHEPTSKRRNTYKLHTIFTNSRSGQRLSATSSSTFCCVPSYGIQSIFS